MTDKIHQILAHDREVIEVAPESWFKADAPPGMCKFMILTRNTSLSRIKALEVAVERLNRISEHSPESIDKVVLLVNIEGYRQCAKEALEEIAKILEGQ